MKLKCGCRLIGGEFPDITYCPMHKAAPELLAALTKARGDINWMLNNRQFLTPFVFDYIDQALAKVTPEK